SVEIRPRPGTRPVTAVDAMNRLSAGPPHWPERRRAFTFIHEVKLGSALERRLSQSWDEGRVPTVTVAAEAGIGIADDGRGDIGPDGLLRRRTALPRPSWLAAPGTASASAAPAKPVCATAPVVEVAPHGHLTIPLPACTGPVRWSFTSGASA